MHGDLWVLDGLDAQPRMLEIDLAGPRTGRRPRPLGAGDKIGDLAVDRTGRATAVEVLGSVHWLTTRDGPAPALADTPGVRARLPQVLGPAATAENTPPHVAWITDADGDDAIEVGPADGSAPTRRFGAGRLGRVLELAASPDGARLAVAAHDGRVLVADVASGEIREVARSEQTDASGLAWSPDSAWLAWSHPGAEGLRQILARRVDGADGVTVEVTPLRFVDTDPVFTLDGLHLAFLSTRTLDPVYADWVFDLETASGAFCAGVGRIIVHNSPRRGLEFVTRKITWHAAAIKHGKLDKLKLGNLEARRDWGYAKDYVEAMWMIVQQDEPGDYVIATNSDNSVRDCVEIAFDEAGVSDWESYVETDQSLVRPAEVDHLIGDYSKAERELGWRPKTSFEELIRLMTRSDLELLER